MKRVNKVRNFIVTLLSLVFLISSTAFALEIVLDPANAQREIGGKVRVHIYAEYPIVPFVLDLFWCGWFRI